MWLIFFLHNYKGLIQLPVVSLLIPTIMIFPLLKKTVRIERKNIIHPFLGTEKDLDGDRVRLFNTVTVIFMLGSALSFLIGYFGMNRNLGNELLLAAFLLLMGMVVKCIPLITKNQTAQNSIFLIISISCLLYFIIKHAGTGGLTVWAIYILVLLFTVVLGSSHAYVITAISVVVQIVFWIILPEVSVTIDINEYVARIFIIVLSFVAVQYLINEFTAKIRGYQRFAREQEVLEKISSSFISVNSKNVREKINEMFEMAVEILEFNHAYITGFGQDYKDATIVNMYMKDVDRESFPYYPGMRFSTAELPMFKFLIEQNEPIVCEDTANISFDKDGLHRDYFMSRGVKSFLAIPITIDNKTGGIFFIEYRDRIDGRLAESRLNFLKIIANILGDARNKALYEERLYHSAYFDEATKLANRNMLKIRLEQIIRNRIELEKIAVLNIEIENLRMINDTFGHEVGEQVMIESAAILEKQLEGCYDISRAGEGDFVVVLSEVKCHEQIMECAEKLLASFSHPILTETGVEALYVVVHIGISVYPDDGRDADTLLKNADLAGYEARNNNEKIVFYTKRLENYIIENTLLTNRLFKALKNEEFFLEFQPQINCSTGKTAGVEALLRWTSDGNKRIPPERFIPILEQTGLIYDIGLWVLEQALQQHNKLIARGFPPLRISVNLSVVQFQGENIIRDFRKIIEESGVNPKYIDLEITESWISNHSDDIIGKLRKLKELGVNIAIDDFGKGYSSLHRLKFVPFDRIKIDKDIIQNLDFEGKKASIAEIIVLLARAFNAVITAEGVETKEQADFLKSVACDEIQGYYFSRPLSTKALEEFLKKEYRLAD